MSTIFLNSAVLSGRFTSRPTRDFRGLMMAAATNALDSAGLAADQVDALYAGAMGSFEPEGFVGPIPIRLANGLGLNHADITPMQIGSSEAGAWVLKQAYEGMRHGGYNNVLVVAGEQMNRTVGEAALPPAKRLAERMARNRAISEILDDRERRHGLNMIRVGDLLMDMVRAGEGLTREDVCDVLLPLVAVSKYGRVGMYPKAHLFAKAGLSLAEYQAGRHLTSYFRLHDVTPTSSGAVALVLSKTAGPRALEVVGMGQAFVPISLAARAGDPTRPKAVGEALRRACSDAGESISWLRSSDFALIHDAFPSIEYAFLSELGFSPSEIIDRMTSGWSNPFGGLKTCGHALGASGLLQVAKAYHRIFKDPEYIAASAIESLSTVDRCFTTSVGGPLTHVVVTMLRRHPRPAPSGDAAISPVADSTTVTDEQTSRYWDWCGSLQPGTGLVLGSTRIRHMAAFSDDANALLRTHQNPQICLIQTGGSESDGRKLYAFSESEIPVGTVVSIGSTTIGTEHYYEITGVVGHRDLKPRLDEESRAALVAECVAKLELYR